MQTIHDIIKRRSLAMVSKTMRDNPYMSGENMRHYRCTLTNETGHSIELTFSMGSAHGMRHPEIAEVLDCLASDAAMVENARNFDEWCSELGCSSDSRKEHRRYAACKAQTNDLKSLMGPDYQSLLFDTERL